jgi:hypothetical protein
MMKLDAMVQEQINCNDQLGCSVTRGATGRTTNFETPEHDCQEALVKQWVMSENKDTFLSHPAAEKFQSMISEIPVLNGSIIKCYRGCYRRSDMYPRPLPLHFGPPPLEHTKDGRYNYSRKPVLYLCSTAYGVAYEIKDDCKPINDLFYQEYILDTSSLRLADFANPNLDNFIRIVFDYAENGLRSGNIDKNDPD